MRWKSQKLTWDRAAVISTASLGFALGACGSSSGSTGTPGALSLTVTLPGYGVSFLLLKP